MNLRQQAVAARIHREGAKIAKRPLRSLGALCVFAVLFGLFYQPVEAQQAKGVAPKQTQGRPARDPVYPRSEIRAIRTVLDEQVKAWNRGDLDAFMKGYWKSDQLTFFSGGTKLQGWQATMDRYIRSYKSEGREMGQLQFVDLQVELLGSHAAVVRGGWELKMSKEQRSGLFTLIFRKTDQGWKIIHDHTGAREQ